MASLFVVVIMPNLAFASWWNPFSWNIFSIFHKVTKIEVLQVATTTAPTPSVNQVPSAANNSVVSQTNLLSDSMADWKTYRNEKFGFEARYPNEGYDVFEIKPNPNIGDKFLAEISFNGSIEIIIYENLSKKNDRSSVQSEIMKFYGNNNWPFNFPYDVESTKVRESSIDNHFSIRSDYMVHSEGEGLTTSRAVQTFTSSPQYVYKIDYSESDKISDQIISTFKFITPVALTSPTLSADHKNILDGGKILLTIDDDAIFNYFKTSLKIEDRELFNTKTRFKSIVVSQDKLKIGFTIENDTLMPDTIAGIFYSSRSINKINLLTNYYIGNEFISFSPSGANLMYKSGCFEGMCVLYIKDSETLASKVDLSDSEYADMRTKDVKFVRWISDNEVEYKLGTELKRASFETKSVIEKASGIIKSVYSKDGKNYIDIDYVELNPKWQPGGMTGSAYTNVNPKIRTFEISPNAKFFQTGGITPINFSDFQNFFGLPGGSIQSVNPWDIVITNGIVTQITEHYLP